MERAILFSDNNERTAARYAYEWVREKGGAFITQSCSMMHNALQVNPKSPVTDTFVNVRKKHLKLEKPVYLGVTGKNDFMAIGPRIAIISPKDHILAVLEAQMNANDCRECMQEMLVCTQFPDTIRDWAEYYLPKAGPVGSIPDNWQELSDDSPSDADIPSDIKAILAEAAKDAAGETTGHLHIDMVNSLKYDINVNWESWRVVTRRDLMRGCMQAGITIADAYDLLGWYDLKLKGSAPRPSTKHVIRRFKH